MAQVEVNSPGTSATVYIQCNVSEGTVDIPNNRSYMYVTLILYVSAYNGAGGPFKTSPASYGYVNSSLGTLISVSMGYDLRSSVASSILWGAWEGWVTHDADGKKTVTFTYEWQGNGGTPLGNGGPAGHSIVLTDIPRGPRIKIGAIWKNTILYIKSSGIWKLALLYIKSSGIWKITGG